MHYYYLDSDGQTVHGPYNKDDIRSMLAARRLTGSTLCAPEGGSPDDWKTLNQMVDEIYSTHDPEDKLSPMGRANDPDLQLVLRTRQSQEAEARYTAEQSTRTSRNSYPCWELVRVGVPDPIDEDRDWPARWSIAGGSFYGEGRMIALKGSPIWVNLGSHKLFSDALDTEHPPYAYGSHMTRRAVKRATCIELGIPVPPIEHDPDATPLSPETRALLEGLARDLRAEVEAGRKPPGPKFRISLE